MAKVKFLKGESTAYKALGTWDADTFYFTTDDNVLYLGEHRIGADPSIATKVDELEKAIQTLNGSDETTGSVDKKIKDAIEALKSTVIGNLDNLTISVKETVVAAMNQLETEIKALDAKIGDVQTLTTASKEVVGAINELAEEVTKFSSDEAVNVVKVVDVSDVAARYQVTQGGKNVGVTIDVPKDMVVQSARVETLETPDEQQHKAGTYIVLTIANSESSELWIDVGKLVDIYTASKEESNVKVTIDQSANTIKAEIEAGKITATEIAGATITKDKLATDITDSLAKADSALQEEDITEGTTAGAITVNETAVKVHGLGDLALKNEEDLKLSEYAKTADLGDLATKNQTALESELNAKYDAIGAAASAKTAAISEAKNYTDSQLEWGTIEAE